MKQTVRTIHVPDDGMERLLIQESMQPETWWWLSFASEEGFRGAVLVRARGFATAFQKVCLLELNPGGQVCGAKISDNMVEKLGHEQYANKLLSRKTIEEKMGGAFTWP